MPDNEELRREIKVLQDKVRGGEDLAIAERRRNHELAAAYGEARSKRARERGLG